MLSAADAYSLAFQPARVATVLKNQIIVEWAGAQKPKDEKLEHAVYFARQVIAIHETEKKDALRRIEQLCAQIGHAPGPPPRTPDEIDAWAAKIRSAAKAQVADGSLEATALEAGAAAAELHEGMWVARNAIYLRIVIPDNVFLRGEMVRLAQQIERGRQRLLDSLRRPDLPAPVQRADDALRPLLERIPPVAEAVTTEAFRAYYDWASQVKGALGALESAFALPVEKPVSGAASDEERALLEEILAHPDDMAPRLRFAELAARRNDPRASLIQTQMRIHALRTSGPMGVREVELKKQAAQLVNAHPEWSEPVLRLGAQTAVFRRGFVEEITIDVKTFVARADELYRVAPILHLRLKDAAGQCAALAAAPQLGRIKSLGFDANWITDADMEALAASPHVERVRWLDLTRNKITDRGVEAIAASPHFRSLVYCGLLFNPCEDPVDRRVHDDETRFHWEPTELGTKLEAKYGPLAWLHPRVEAWPPDLDQI